MIKTFLKIRVVGDLCLRKKSVSVKKVGSGHRKLLETMLDTMYENKGVGLAAPQVGINERIIIVDIGEGPEAFINPKVVKKEGSCSLEEGCLSVPGVAVHVKRPESIVVQYLDPNNIKQEKTFSDLMARVILHEIDHLDGKLLIDYASFPERLKLRKQLKEIQKQSKMDY